MLNVGPTFFVSVVLMGYNTYLYNIIENNIPRFQDMSNEDKPKFIL